MIYDAASRAELKEHADYEAWVIRECLIALEREQGIQAPLTIGMSDSGPTHVHDRVEESIGAGYAAEVVRKLLPLMFAATAPAASKRGIAGVQRCSDFQFFLRGW